LRAPMPRPKRRRPFGSIRRLPSGRIQARYVCPRCGAMHPAHVTFDTEGDADTWLSGVRAPTLRGSGTCVPCRQAAQEAAKAAEMPFSTYATRWLEDRRLKPATRMLYAGFLEDLLAVFGDQPLTAITRDMVEDWWRELRQQRPDRETGNAHRYALLRTILGSAVRDGRIAANPCQVPGAGQPSGQRRRLNPATDDELDAITAAMPESLALAVHLAAYCALRFGGRAAPQGRGHDSGPAGSQCHPRSHSPGRADHRGHPEVRRWRTGCPRSAASRARSDRASREARAVRP
jgi:hypothetical protein